MPDVFAPVLAGVSTVGAVTGFGYFIDGKLSDEFRDKVRDKLKRVSGADDTWPALFLIMFDRLFVPQQRQRPSFKRSAAASIIILALILILWAVLLPERLDFLIDAYRKRFTSEYTVYAVLFSYFVSGVIINLIADFFSLWESRLVLGRITTKRGAVKIAAYLLVDFTATVAIFAVVYTFAVSVLFAGWVLSILGLSGDFGLSGDLGSDFFFVLYDVIEMMISGGFLIHSNEIEFDFVAACFYTTLFTSVWVWIFMLGGVLWPLFSWLSNVLAVDKYPVGSVMAIGGVFLGLAVTAAGYVRMAIVP